MNSPTIAGSEHAQNECVRRESARNRAQGDTYPPQTLVYTVACDCKTGKGATSNGVGHASDFAKAQALWQNGFEGPNAGGDGVAVTAG